MHVKLATECSGIFSKLCISFMSQITNNTMKFFPIHIYCILVHSVQYSFLYNPVSSIIIILEAKRAGSYSSLAYDRLSVCFASPVLSRRYMYTVNDANNYVPLLLEFSLYANTRTYISHRIILYILLGPVILDEFVETQQKLHPPMDAQADEQRKDLISFHFHSPLGKVTSTLTYIRQSIL